MLRIIMLKTIRKLTSCYLISMLVVLIVPNAQAAQTVSHYAIEASINNAVDKLSVRAEIILEEHGSEELKLLLHPAALNLKVLVNHNPVDFSFTKDAASKPNIYFDGQLLTVSQQALGSNKKLTFEYELPIAAVNYWQVDNLPPDFDLKNGFELGMYTSWLPFQLSNGSFSYQIKVNTPKIIPS